jgi:hypothetical protein
MQTGDREASGKLRDEKPTAARWADQRPNATLRELSMIGATS